MRRIPGGCNSDLPLAGSNLAEYRGRTEVFENLGSTRVFGFDPSSRLEFSLNIERSVLDMPI